MDLFNRPNIQKHDAGSLYMHIPFCLQKCNYCDFVSFAASEQQIDAYIGALTREMRLWRRDAARLRFFSVYLGGGTPSLLSVSQLGRVFDSLHSCFVIEPNAEITLEANPATIDAGKAKAMRDLGVNRASVGLQAIQPELLNVLGRAHTTKDFVNTLDILRSAGIENISADIMYGLPGQTIAMWEQTLNWLCGLDVEHISAYALHLDESVPLFKSVSSYECVLPDADTVADMDDTAQRVLNEAGYEHYEISNYAKRGRECRHNLNYWHNGEYIGIGLAAHGALNLNGQWTRVENTPDLSRYHEMVSQNELPHERTQAIGREEAMFETVMLGFRLTEGLDLTMFEDRFSVRFQDVYAGVIKRLTARNLLIIDNNNAYLTKRGLDIQNTVLLDFLD